MPTVSSRLACAATLALASCTSRVTTSTPASATGPVSAITPADLERRLFIIAHDSMMGRETGSEGAFKTTAYIAAEFQRLGLKPAGDNGTYFQVVPFWRGAGDASSRLSAAGRHRALSPHRGRPPPRVSPRFPSTLRRDDAGSRRRIGVRRAGQRPRAIDHR